MTADKNIELVKSLFVSFQKNDIPAIVEYITDDCQWGVRTQSSEVPWHRSFNGKQAVPGYFKALAEEVTLSKFEPTNFLASVDHVSCTVAFEMTVKRTGKIVRGINTHHAFFKNGRISQFVVDGADSTIQNAWTNGSTTFDNQTLARNYFECMDTRDLDGLTKMFASTAKIYGLTPMALDTKGFTETMSLFFRAFPDSRMPIDGVVANANEVCIRHRLEGTHKENLMGIAPTQKRVSMNGTITLRTNLEGQVTEAWVHADMLGLFVQLGAVNMPKG